MPIENWQTTPQYKTREIMLPPSAAHRRAAREYKRFGGKWYLDHNPRHVCVLGMGPSLTDWLNKGLTQELTTDYCDEVWAINMAANVLWHDVVFWMDDLQAQQKFKPGLFDLLRRRGRPIITTKAYPGIVESYDYPIDETATLGIPVFGKPYLNNGVAQTVAYAIWKRVEKIELYGCDFTYPDRNFAESGRACLEAWITLACTRGIEVQLPPMTSLFDTHGDQGIYGYIDQPVINLPNGVKFHYEKKGDPRFGQYRPEDSSGVKKDGLSNGNVGRAQEQGQAGTGRDAAAIAKSAGLRANGAAAPAADSARAPGEGVRHKHRSRRTKAEIAADHDRGGGRGSLLPEAAPAIPLADGSTQP